MIDTSRVKGMLSAIKAGYGFKNIASPSVTKLTSIAIPDVQTLLAMATTQSAATGTPMPTEAALTAARNTIIAAQQQATAYAAHVSGISGVNLIGEPNFITMAKTAQAARDIDGVKSCDPVLQVFGSIHRAAAITNSVSVFADSLKIFLDNIPNAIGTIQSEAVLLTNTMSKQIVDDNNAYIKAKLTVAQFSAAANLISIYEDECLNGILMSIMTDRLKTEVVKASEAAKKKNTSSIFDEDVAYITDDPIVDESPIPEDTSLILIDFNTVAAPTWPNAMIRDIDGRKMLNLYSQNGGNPNTFRTRFNIVGKQKRDLSFSTHILYKQASALQDWGSITVKIPYPGGTYWCVGKTDSNDTRFGIFQNGVGQLIKLHFRIENEVGNPNYISYDVGLNFSDITIGFQSLSMWLTPDIYLDNFLQE